MLDLFRKGVIGATLDAHITNYFNIDVVANKFSKRFLTSSLFISPITTFVGRDADIVMENKKYSVAYASKELMGTVEPKKGWR